MENLRGVTGDIKDNLNQKAASRKDEIAVMKAMLNDPDYQVGIYSKKGKIGEYCPYADSRKMLANIISSTTKIPITEAQDLADNYEITKADATTMVKLSKEFVNTYLSTGRKLPLGGRQSMNVSLILKHIDEKDKIVPSKTSDVSRTHIPEHDAVRSICPCPEWLK